MKRTVVNYHSLTSDPETLAELFSWELIESTPADRGETTTITSHIDPGLRHHVASLDDLDEPAAFHPWLKNTLDAHALLADCPSDEEAQRMLDKVSEAIDGTMGRLPPVLAEGEAALKERDKRIEALGGELEALRAELAEQRKYQA